jgi:peptide methionine sulfoxide reductase MsrA
VQITYDKNVTNLDEIFKVFFTVHDPTLNRQGADWNTIPFLFFLNEIKKGSSVITAMKSKNL